MKQRLVPEKGTLKTAFDLAWPAILETFFMTFAGLVDSYMVSSLGSLSVAAVGLTTQPKFIGLSLFMALSVAVSALVARRKGEQRQEAANAIALTAIVFSIVMGLVIGLTMAYYAGAIMKLCGSSEGTHDLAVAYFRIVIGGLVFNAVQSTVNAAQRGAGNTRITMKTNLVSNTINIILNYCMIGGHFGFPAMGIRGAALATVLGTVAGALISVASIRYPDGFISIPYMFQKAIKPDLESLKHLYNIGYSIFFEQILMRIGFLATAVMAAKQGDDPMAAHQIGMNIMGLTFSFGDGLQAAAVALIGFSLGSKNKEKAYEYGAACRFIGGVISCFLAVTYFFGARALYSIFFKEEVIIEYGIHIMYIIIFTCIFQIAQVIYMGCLRGAGDTAYTAFASTISVTIVRTAVSYICGFMLGLGIEGIWLGVLADQISRFLFASIRFKQGKWVNIKI